MAALRRSAPQPAPAHRRTRGPWAGFTLLETLAVVAVIGILMGMVWFGYQFIVNRSHDTSATEQVRSWIARQQAYARDHGTFAASSDDLGALGDGSRLVGEAPSTGPDEASVAVGSDGAVTVALLSKSGTCFYGRSGSLLTGGVTSFGEHVGACAAGDVDPTE